MALPQRSLGKSTGVTWMGWVVFGIESVGVEREQTDARKHGGAGESSGGLHEGTAVDSVGTA